ncbi:hypothetical protein ACFPTO_18245 [Paraburkholderia denitrificans]|uniref:Uncharacterized protein n=1 Tax=Paraburkholderia denitrificans TaxID=694025 RepID=A0ABW0JCH9_9BURK
MVTRRHFVTVLCGRISSAANAYSDGKDMSGAHATSKPAKAPPATNAAFDAWKDYARELEQKLADARADLTGMRVLRDAAIHELGKVDPNNHLMIQANRQKILDEGYAKA